VVLARKRMAGERVESCDALQFDVVEVADTMGWQLALVKRGLRQLQWSTQRGGVRVCVRACVRMWVCVCERESESVCVCVCERERERERVCVGVHLPA